MPLAGETIIPGKLPGERIATEIVTSSSATITTTETVIATVVAALVTGRTYRLRFAGAINNSQIASTGLIRLREDSVSGTQLQVVREHAHTAAQNYPLIVEVEYTAVATGNKTFVATLVRGTGTGDHSLTASASQPTYLYTDYIRG